MRRETFIRCYRCYAIHRIINDDIPKQCIWCDNPFNKHYDNETFFDIIYNALTGHSDKGYMICDRLGFVKGTELRFPEERR